MSRILNGDYKSRSMTETERATGFSGAGSNPISRVQQFGWEIVDKPGVFRMVSKHDLYVDPIYQRENVKNFRVNDIAANWSWSALGVLLVALRPDGRMFVFDGQHRKLAGDKRVDIELLPCMVFDAIDIAVEAKAFRRVNAERTAVGALGRFRADLIAGDEVSIAVRDMVHETGYAIAKTGGNSDFQVSCVGLLKIAMQSSPALTKAVWNLCVNLCNGKAVTERLFGSLFYLEVSLLKKNCGMSIFDRHNMQVLERAGAEQIIQKVAAAKSYYGKGGNLIGAQGVVELLNHRRQTRRLPNVSNAVSIS